MSTSFRPGMGTTGELPPDPVAAENFLRGSGGEEGGTGKFKEWYHFCILAESFHVVVNFYLQWNEHRSGQGPERGFMTLLLRKADGEWSGAMETRSSQELMLRTGALSVGIGANRLEYIGGKFSLVCRISHPPIELECALAPKCVPFTSSSSLLDGAESLKWCTVPRLEATGRLAGKGFSHVFQGMPAYHDHNWGRFRWGGDYAWEWAAFLAETARGAYTMVFSRITDQARMEVFSQSLMVWIDGVLWKAFVNRALSVEMRGFLHGTQPLRIPPMLRMAASGQVFDLPSEIRLSGRDAESRVDIHFTLEDGAEIAVPPDETGLGLSILSEVSGRGRFRISAGAAIESGEGPAISEFNRATR